MTKVLRIAKRFDLISNLDNEGTILKKINGNKVKKSSKIGQDHKKLWYLLLRNVGPKFYFWRGEWTLQFLDFSSIS